MQHVQRTLMSFSMIVAMMLVGCGSEPGGATPKDAATKFRSAIESADREAALAMIQTDENTEAFAEQYVDFAVTQTEFRQAMVDEYGEEGWTEFESAMGKGMRMPLPTAEQIENAEVAMSEEDDTATLTVAAEGEGQGQTQGQAAQHTLQLVRSDGRWFIAGQSIAQAAPAQREQAVAVYEAISQVLEDQMDNIGAEDATPQSIAANVQQQGRTALQRVMQEQLQQQMQQQQQQMPQQPQMPQQDTGQQQEQPQQPTN